MTTQKKLKTSLLITAILFFNGAMGQDTIKIFNAQSTWEYVASTTNKNKWYIHNKYLSKENGQIKMWVKIELDTTTFKKKFYKNAYELHLLFVDCKNQKVQTLASTLYNSSGVVVDTFTDPYPRFEYVTPDSALEAVFEKICALYN